MAYNNVFSRVGHRLAAMLGLGLAAAAPATASGPMAPSAAPAEWVRYAEGTTSTIKDWLQADDENALRLRAYLHASNSAGAGKPLMLKIWVAPDGTVSRVGFQPFAHEEANAGLRTLVEGRKLPAPPAKMLLPINIAVELEPAPSTGGTVRM
ncbi:TonB C-terminal domain-containing protein [Sandaracinobacter sp. RS1-74]|uniref:TonB C-terminal domain-containing protein n=1 Tax=Sandaracinobacteroides sayramensis TaxID=2913411 RepID=UPI001EDBA2A1|nr:TonB C-terminal domain-containing protein [Sandaracinobacteroides sayramensis]MCG2840699.1 TonB C-terminal domain-containing protein [Sandaracinobacteroides sayramensis]